MLVFVLRVVVIALCFSLAAHAQELHIAAASDLQSALPQIVQQFEHECHCKIIVSYGSSGNFYQQLQNAAPFDVFLSADIQYPEKLQAAALTASAPVEYAAGKIVLWTRNDSHVEITTGLKSLTNAAVKRVAIANPAHAPYGRAAEAALKSEGIYDRVAPKLVMGENISQTAIFAQSGNADGGIIALSLALNSTMKNSGRYVEIPASEYPAIRQAGVVMKNTHQPELATRFLAFLRSEAARSILERFGFGTK
jgi:molybdate transport system substrate-binding protein